MPDPTPVTADPLISGPGRVLITRPSPGAQETARRVEALGRTPIIAPLQLVRPVEMRLPRPARIAALVLTSRNAIPALPPAWHATPVHAVGDATARLAREAGFTTVHSADGDAVALAAAIARVVPAGATLLLATGAGVGLPIAAMLRRLGYRVIRRIAYRVVAATALPPAAAAALGDTRGLVALVFSAEAGRVLAELVRAAGLTEATRHCEAITISSRAAMALRGQPWRAIHVAARPTQDAMLAMLR